MTTISWFAGPAPGLGPGCDVTAPEGHVIWPSPIKTIYRELGILRKVFRKILRSEATEFRYRREEQPMPRLGPWQEALDRLLASNEGKPRRERLTLIRVFEDCAGSATKVAMLRCDVMLVVGCAIARQPRPARSFR